MAVLIFFFLTLTDIFSLKNIHRHSCSQDSMFPIIMNNAAKNVTWLQNRWYPVLFMVSLAAVFGSLVTGLYLLSASRLAQNEQLAYQRALVRVFGLGNGDAEMDPAELVQARIVADETIADPLSGREFTLLKAYTNSGRQDLLAYGFRFVGPGFWGPIEGVMSVSPDLARTRGFVVLAHSETPGLGGRIAEPQFGRQFEQGVDVSPEAAGRILRITADPPDPASPSAGRHVEAVTGATQTCVALEKMLNQNIAAFRRAMEAAGKLEGTP